MSTTRRRYPYWLTSLPFVLSHVAVLGAIWSGVTVEAVVVCVVLYGVRMFFVSAGYHRYFSHRTFKTSRLGQFLLAFGAETSSQRGVLWWAAHHRDHHKYSDTEQDVHSPRAQGFWFAHVGWIFARQNAGDKSALVRDLAKYPELRFLNRFWMLPPAMLAAATLLLFGWPGLFIGFFLSTVVLWHATFCINSLAHLIGRRRFDTTDDSRNSLLLALLCFGEGWHNNHHRYMASTRQGFYWWQIDISYLILKCLSWVGLVWDLREPPERILAAGLSPMKLDRSSPRSADPRGAASSSG